jgi:transcription-repair coupling factor (superfamily II helicase)
MPIPRTDSWTSSLRALVDEIRTATEKRSWRVHGLRAGARPFFLARLIGLLERPALVVSPNSKEAERLTADLRFFLGESEESSPFSRRVHFLPSWEVAPFEDISPAADVIARHIEGLYQLRQGMRPIVVTTPEALLQRVPPRDAFAARHAYLVEGDEIDRDQLARQLEEWGYRGVGAVEDRGEFSLRGGIVDVFPPAHPNPLRLVLAGDTIEALHDFDPVSQRLLGRPGELLVLPVREFDPRAAPSSWRSAVPSGT